MCACMRASASVYFLHVKRTHVYLYVKLLIFSLSVERSLFRAVCFVLHFGHVGYSRF